MLWHLSIDQCSFHTTGPDLEAMFSRPARPQEKRDLLGHEAAGIFLSLHATGENGSTQSLRFPSP